MNAHFKKVFADSIQIWSLILTLFFLIITTGVVVFYYRSLPPVVPLYNKLAWGYDRLGKTWQMFVPLCVAIVFCFTNFLAATIVQGKIPLLGRFLALTNVVIALFTCIFLVKIIFIVL